MLSALSACSLVISSALPNAVRPPIITADCAPARGSAKRGCQLKIGMLQNVNSVFSQERKLEAADEEAAEEKENEAEDKNSDKI